VNQNPVNRFRSHVIFLAHFLDESVIRPTIVSDFPNLVIRKFTHGAAFMAVLKLLSKPVHGFPLVFVQAILTLIPGNNWRGARSTRLQLTGWPNTPLQNVVYVFLIAGVFKFGEVESHFISTSARVNSRPCIRSIILTRQRPGT
jgi:hypothetical protein